MDPSVAVKWLLIAGFAGIDRSNLAAIVADLCDDGLVESTRHEVDRRRYVLIRA